HVGTLAPPTIQALLLQLVEPSRFSFILGLMCRFRLVAKAIWCACSAIVPLVVTWPLCASPAPKTESPYGLPSRPQSKPWLHMPSEANGPMPKLLSQTGAFKDVRTLTPSESLIPYDLNVSFWSDGASKLRWIAVPNENGLAQKISFSPTGEW